MANEYLERTPTSTGNRSVYTWAGWVKRNKVDQDYYLFSSGNDANNIFYISIRRDANNNNLTVLFRDGDSTSHTLVFNNNSFRDPGSWMHFVVSVNTTIVDSKSDRCKVYINGARLTGWTTDQLANLNQNALTATNAATETCAIGDYSVSAGADAEDFQLFDYFLVDGQALTPDVFGFYKDGDGYQSSGTTNSTDFKPGQWSPRAPKSIKYTINRSGGFGVNGFYLPMNDSSNPGADFHCDPNSIITLKGEDLPQPRNGAPTTSDAYVSELRDDPFAANLVLAVPGISTSTSANLITNGTFDTNINGWTTVQATTSWQLGTLRIIPNASVNGAVYQSITTEIGKRYTVTMEVVAAGALQARIHIGTSTDIDSADKYTYTSGNYNTLGVGSIAFSFTPTTTTTVVWLEVGGGTQTQVDFDNVVVKQENVPRDYSADIKGSGTNKTLTANGNAGVGYELGGYYGSAMTFDGADATNFNLGNDSDFDFGTGDFTIEFWRNRNSVSDTESYFTKYDNGETQSFWFGAVNNGRDGFYWYDTNGEHSILTSDNTVVASQYDHLCAERHNGTVSLYVNGVSVGISTLGALALNTTTDNVKIGANDDDNGTIYYPFDGEIQDLRVYKGLAKYKGGFDVPKPYTPVGIEAFRTTADTCKNNFATLNPAILNNPGLSDGNLKIVGGSGWRGWVSTFSFTSGKYYMEMHFPDTSTGGSYYEGMGLKHDGFLSNSSGEYFGDAVGKAVALVRSNGIALYNNGNQGDIATGTYTGSHTMGMAIDADSGKVWWSMDGTWIGANPSTGSNASYTFTAGQTVIPGVTSFNSSVTGDLLTLNFGQNPTFSGQVTAGTNADGNGKGLFKYAPPTGFLSLCEDNLPTPAIADPGEHFKSVLYKNSQKISNVGFKPDLVWTKSRNQLYSHYLYDSVRGVGGIGLTSDEPDPEGTYDADGILSFDDDGFTLSTDAGLSETEAVAWCWKAGGAAVTNNDGTIESQISVNQTAGFSIVSYTGNNTNGASIGHGLGKKPNLIIVKERNGASGWFVFQNDIGPSGFLQLHDTPPVTIDAGGGSPWFGTEPTDQVFTVGANGATNDNTRPIIAYCWAEIENYSKIGRFFGNGDPDGPFVYCGFKPAFIIFKNADATGNWVMCDSSRDSSNPVFGYQVAEGNSIEERGTALFDSLSNGFKIRNAWTSFNGDGNGIIFMAFAESPFQTANAK